MNFRLLRQFAALVSAHSESVVDASEPVSNSALWNYFDQTRKHVGRWSSFLEKSSAEVHGLSETMRKQTWHQAEPVLAEVFALEMLSRVWSTVLIASDVRRGASHAAPVAHSAMSGQRHLRHLCLGFMVNYSHGTEPRVAHVDRFRQRIERWTDVLIGHMAARYAVVDFAFDHKRALEFGHDQLERRLEPSDPIWKLIHSGMEISFPDAALPRVAHSRYLSDFAQAVVDGLPHHLCRPGRPFAPYLADQSQLGEIAGYGKSTLAHPLREPGVVLSFADLPLNRT